MNNVQSKIEGERKRKAASREDIPHFYKKEVDNFLKIFIELVNEEPEEIKKSR